MLYLCGICLYFVIWSVVISDAKLNYFNAGNPGWRQSLLAFIHKFEGFCSFADLPHDNLVKRESEMYQNIDDIPYFSPCNLALKDMLNLYKLVQYNEKEEITNLTGCDRLPDETQYYVNKTVICDNFIKNRCILRFDNKMVVLPGTQLQYQCRNSKAMTMKVTVCRGNSWDSPIVQCGTDENSDKMGKLIKKNENYENSDNVNGWSTPTIWRHYFTPCGQSILKNSTSYNDSFGSEGAIAKLGGFPWRASIYDKTNISGDALCEATLISFRLLLTAAFCFDGIRYNATDFQVAVGGLRKNRLGIKNDAQQLYNVENIITHRSYQGGGFRYQNDIAILVTKDEITFNSAVSSICLINENFPKMDNHSLYTTGWSENGTISDNDLRYFQFPYVPFEYCFNFTEAKSVMTVEKFCVPNNNKSIGFVNTGAGLVVEGPRETYYLFGIAGIQYGEDRNSFVYCTNVPFYHNWIYDQIYRTFNEV